MGEDDGHLQEISLAIDLAYLGIILLGYLALFGNQEKERIFYFYNIRKAFYVGVLRGQSGNDSLLL